MAFSASYVVINNCNKAVYEVDEGAGSSGGTLLGPSIVILYCHFL